MQHIAQEITNILDPWLVKEWQAEEFVLNNTDSKEPMKFFSSEMIR